MEGKRVLASVNLLDLRKATEESVAAYSAIQSANLVVYSPETAHLLHQLNIESINGTAEVPANVHVELVMGPLTLDGDTFANLSEPVGFLVMGPVSIGPDVKVEHIERGLAAVMVMGPVTVPEHLAGAFQSKTPLVMGPVASYPILDRSHMGDLVIDATYLETVNPGTEMTVVGSLRIQEDVPAGLIRKKIAKLFVTGGIMCYAHNEQELRAALAGSPSRIRVIPEGYRVVDKPIDLDRQLLSSITDKRVYFLRSIKIAPDVDERLLSERLDGLMCAGKITCPQKLQGALAKVCDLLDTEAFFYDGELWEIDYEMDLLPERFDYVDGKVTLVVTGLLRVDPSITPELLVDRVARVELFGDIECSPEQQAALESRIGSCEGIFQRFGASQDPAKDGEKPGYANYLAL